MRKINRGQPRSLRSARRSVVLAPTELDESARLVGLGFRYWVMGRQTGTIACWERAWALYSGVFGVAGGRVALTHLSSWVDAVGTTTCRSIEVEEVSCPHFCRDECVAISMIAACQQGICPAMRACAYALVESSHINGIVDEAQDFAATLMSLDHVLSPACIMREPVDVIAHSGALNGVAH